MSDKFTISDFDAKYPHDEACLDDIFQKRYGSLKVCPECDKKTKFYKVTARKCYACQFCGHQLHPLAGTIFHKSDTSLKSWFFAIWLFANSKNGVSAMEIQRKIGVTYKTAWRMAKQIRLLFDKKPKKPLKNHVEMDETYVGRKVKMGTPSKGLVVGRGAPGKTIVFGMVERGGDVKATITPNVKSNTILPIIHEYVEPRTVIHTDEYAIYNPLRKNGFRHRKCSHGKGQYVRGITHTNTIEGFWSQLKRSITGTYHSVSPKYLQHYVDEFSYRYNLRNDKPSSFFPSMLSEVARQV